MKTALLVILFHFLGFIGLIFLITGNVIFAFISFYFTYKAYKKLNISFWSLVTMWIIVDIFSH